MTNGNELIRAIIDKKVRDSLIAQQSEHANSNLLDRFNNIGNRFNNAGKGFSAVGNYLSNNTSLAGLGAKSQAIGNVLQGAGVSGTTAGAASGAAGSVAGGAASGAAMSTPVTALVALGAMALNGANRHRAEQAGVQAQQLAESAIEENKSKSPQIPILENSLGATHNNLNQVSQNDLPQNLSADVISNLAPLSSTPPQLREKAEINPEEIKKTAFSNIANGLDDFLAGYKENKTQGFDWKNLQSDSSKGAMQRLGEGAGTIARISQNPIVQGVIAGGLSGLFSGDPLYGLSSGYKYANSKYKANLFKDILAQQGVDVGNNNGIIDASDLSKILAARRYQKDYMSRGEYDKFRLDSGELGIDDYNTLINNPSYNPNEILNTTGYGNIAKANRYNNQNKTDRLNNFMSMEEYNRLRLDNDLITPEEYEKIINSPDYKPDDIVNISGINAVSKAGKYIQDNKNSRSQNYWRNQNKGQNVIRVEYGEKPDTHNYTHVTYGEKPENKSTTYVKYENKPQYTSGQTTPKAQSKSSGVASKKSASNSERVKVTSPDGKVGTIPKNNLIEALKEGYKLFKDATK